MIIFTYLLIFMHKQPAAQQTNAHNSNTQHNTNKMDGRGFSLAPAKCCQRYFWKFPASSWKNLLFVVKFPPEFISMFRKNIKQKILLKKINLFFVQVRLRHRFCLLKFHTILYDIFCLHDCNCCVRLYRLAQTSFFFFYLRVALLSVE